MKFVETIITAKKVLNGADSAELKEGESLIIEANGTSVVKEEVPKGKKWRVIFNITIEEIDK
jgi:hypothetical protein